MAKQPDATRGIAHLASVLVLPDAFCDTRPISGILQIIVVETGANAHVDSRNADRPSKEKTVTG